MPFKYLVFDSADEIPVWHLIKFIGREYEIHYMPIQFIQANDKFIAVVTTGAGTSEHSHSLLHRADEQRLQLRPDGEGKNRIPSIFYLIFHPSLIIVVTYENQSAYQ